MNRVAVTGIGVISPVGNGAETFWNALTGGVCGVGPITRFDTTDYKVKLAAEVKDFDCTAYGIDKGSARRLDLFTQYAMAAVQQAMDDAQLTGVAPERLGVYVGSGIGGMTTFTQETEKLITRGPNRVSPLFIPMMIGNMASGNIAIKYNAKGPCLPVVTACATSTHAVGEAFHAIKYGLADAIIAGGAEATILPLAVAGFSNMKALSTATDPACASLPFDARRAGFVMGEGAGILVLENYDHAVARGAKIYAEVVGYGNTCDAHHITAPDPEAEGGANAVRIALAEAGGCEGQTVYVNAHGTGTSLNDSSETKAIKKAFGEEFAREHVMVSSTKSMTGHMLGAAGGVEAIVCALALKNGVIPPTIHLNEPDPACDLDNVPNVKREAQADLAVSISLGFGGHNGVIAMRRV